MLAALLLEYSTVGWNVVETVSPTGGLAGATLIGFGADSAIEVVSAVGVVEALRKAGPHAPIAEESAAEKRALYVVAITFFLLAAYISYEGLSGLLRHQEPVTSPVGIVLSVLSLVVMPILAYAKAAHRQADGQPGTGCRLQRDLGVLLPVTGAAHRRWILCIVRLVVGRFDRRAGHAASDYGKAGKRYRGPRTRRL